MSVTLALQAFFHLNKGGGGGQLAYMRCKPGSNKRESKGGSREWISTRQDGRQAGIEAGARTQDIREHKRRLRRSCRHIQLHRQPEDPHRRRVTAGLCAT